MLVGSHSIFSTSARKPLPTESASHSATSCVAMRFPTHAAAGPAISTQCTRSDLNPHALRRRNLNPVGVYRDAAR